jgi:hypothetical protein
MIYRFSETRQGVSKREKNRLEFHSGGAERDICDCGGGRRLRARP